MYAARRLRPARGWSKTETDPPLGAINPAARLSSVDLPHPLGPTTETNEPAATSRLTLCSAAYCAKFLLTWSRRIAVGSAKSLLPGKNENMLARKRLYDVRETKSFRFDLGLGFLDAHLVFGLDRDGRIFLAILEQHQPSVRLQGFPHFPQHFLRLGEFMIHIHQQNQVEFAFGQFGVRFGPEHGF